MAHLQPGDLAYGHRSYDTPSVMGGFASPPQPDLLLTSGYLTDGVFRQGSYLPLDPTSVAGVTDLRRG